MKKVTTLVAFFAISLFQILYSQTISASITSGQNSSGIGENVAFNNTSVGYVSSEWYIDGSLVATSTNLVHSFSAAGVFEVKLKVYTTDNVYSAEDIKFFTVVPNTAFCGDLTLTDQDPSECDCMTHHDMDSTGSITSETNYRWADRWGNKYCNISIANDCDDNIPFKSSIPVPNPPPPSCQAGYFNLFFIDQTINGTLYSIPQNQRNIVCQVFTDMSQLITPATPGVTVNFEIKAIFDATTSILATAGSYYDVNPAITDAIIHGEVWKAINSGVNDPTLYDGTVNINLAKIFYTGYSNIAGNTLFNQFDLYAIMQHELLHALGFASLITNYAGTSFYSANNLFSTFDEHLLDNGTNVLTNNIPGINYTFNSLGNNCVSVRFDNQNGQQSPVNSYQNLTSGGTNFYGPSHFDDACTNNPSQLYVMNSGIAQNQERRLQQEEVNALCRMGYVISGNYGTPTLTVNGAANPNLQTYAVCSGTGTGIHLAAVDDDYTQPFNYFTTNCTVQNPSGSYSIDVLINDVHPTGTSIVDIEDLNTGALLTATANGFTFAPTTSGLHQIKYRLLHSSGLFSNYAIVSIVVNGCAAFTCANNCNQFVDPNTCNLLCNHEMQKAGWGVFGLGFGLPGPIGPNGTSVTTSPNHFEGWQTFSQSPDWGSGGWFLPTTMNAGKVMGMFSVNQPTNAPPLYAPESFGQCIQLMANTNYILSLYHRRTTNQWSQWQPYNFMAELTNTNNFPIGYTNNQGTFGIGSATWPPPGTQNIYTSPTIPALDNSGWRQHVVSFTPAQFQNFLYFHGFGPNSGLNYFSLDNIELIVDDFTAGPDQTILCQQSAQLTAPCMELTNLHFEWFELDPAGNVILPSLGVDVNVSVTPNTTTSYRLRRYISNLGANGNNGYFVENANSLFAEDDVTIFVTLPSGNAGFTYTDICGNVSFISQNQNGIHQWAFGDGNFSTIVNPSNQYTNIGTYAVTHTVTELGCTATHSEEVIITQFQPSFNPVGPYCQNDIIPSLPTTSLNGIVGTWAPAINNMVTTTYTFTPDAGQCGTPATLTIVIDPPTTPTFNPISSFCSGAQIPSLQTTSLNGITGTWTPAINNTATTTYTFTPNTGQCAVSTTMTVVVNSPPTVSLTLQGIGCSGSNDNLIANGASTYVLSPGGAISSTGIFPITVPASQTTYTVTGTDINGCQNTASYTLNPSPPTSISISPVNPIICLGDALTLIPSDPTINYELTVTDINGPTTTPVIPGTPFIVSPTINTTYDIIPLSGCASNIATTTITVSTAAPVNVQPTNVQATYALITWSPPPSAMTSTSYTVEYRVQGTTTWLSAGPPVPVPTTSLIITGLSPSTIYEARVIADCIADPIHFGTIKEDCDAPLNASVIADYGSTVVIGWNQFNFTGATYSFCFRIAGGTWSTPTTNSQSNLTQKNFNGLLPLTDYEFKIERICPGPPTTTTTQIIPHLTGPPSGCGAPPSPLTMVNVIGNQATVTWNPVVGVGWYEIDYRVVGGTWISAGTLVGQVTFPTKTFLGLTALTNYEVRVRSVCAYIPPSPYSYVTFTTVAVSGCELPPVIQSIQSGYNGSIQLSWIAVTPIGWYQIRYRELGTIPWTNSSANAATTSKWFVGLSLTTTYEFQMRSVCPGGTSVSSWSGLTNGTTMFIPNSTTSDNKYDPQGGLTTNFDVILHPNPSNGHVFLKTNGFSGEKLSIQVTDLSGKEIYQSELGVHGEKAEFEVETSPGTYIVRIVDLDSGETRIKKLNIRQ